MAAAATRCRAALGHRWARRHCHRWGGWFRRWRNITDLRGGFTCWLVQLWSQPEPVSRIHIDFKPGGRLDHDQHPRPRWQVELTALLIGGGSGTDNALPYEVRVVAEPGRALVATVIGTAVRAGQRWIHLDVGAFNGLMESLDTGNRLRFPVHDSRRSPVRELCHLTGPTCDSQDTILFDVPLSVGLRAGDQVYLGCAGAYTTVYASTFNGFQVPDVRCGSD